MNGTDLLNAAAALMQTDDATEYNAFAPTYINLVLAETYRTNNALRESKGLEALTSIPQIAALEDGITYEEELLTQALPLGVLCRIYVDEDDNAKLSMYKQEYAAAVAAAEAQATVIGQTEDVYAQDTEV